MTVEELREAKKELKAEIVSVLKNFHEKTNVHVLNVDARINDVMCPDFSMNGQFTRCTSYNIDIELGI